MTAAPMSFPAAGPLGRLSAVMCVVVAVGGAVAEIMLAWVWMDPAWVEAYVVPHLGLHSVPVSLDAATRIAAFGASMIPMGVLLYLLRQAYVLFDAFRVGNVFTPEAPVRLRRIGCSILVLALLRPLTSMMLGLILTAANPPGQRILALSISIDDYMIAALGGLVLAIGHVMTEAARIADDNRGIV